MRGYIDGENRDREENKTVLRESCYREMARCFRAETMNSCAVVLTLTAAETRLTERFSLRRRRGTVP